MVQDDKAEKDQHRVDVGRRIMLVREALGLSGTEFARRSGISPPALWAIETGRSYPNVMVLTRISDHTGVTADYLLHGKDGGVGRELVKILRKRERQHTK